jgi:hypothetical protein
MGKQKYQQTTGASATTDGQSHKQRDHTKSGKLARRKEGRRLDAIARQVKRIQMLEAAWSKNDTQENMENVDKARLTLQQIRGGVPHKVLMAEFKAEQGQTAPKPAVEVPAEPVKEPVKKTKKQKVKKS